MSTQKRKNIVLLLIVLGIFPVLFYNCNTGGGNHVAVTDESIFNFSASDSVPADVAVNASDTALAEYAWKEFLALNWKASYSQNGLKGMPDIPVGTIIAVRPIPIRWFGKLLLIVANYLPITHPCVLSIPPAITRTSIRHKRQTIRPASGYCITWTKPVRSVPATCLPS